MLDPLVVTYVASHPNSSVVLARLWAVNRDAVLRAVVALYQQDTSNVARVLDVCQVGVGEWHCSGGWLPCQSDAAGQVLTATAVMSWLIVEVLVCAVAMLPVLMPPPFSPPPSSLARSSRP